MLAALQHTLCPPVNALYGLAVQAGWDPRDVPAWVAQQGGVEPPADPGQEAGPPPSGPPVRPARPGDVQPPPLKVRGVLATCGRDLTDLAWRGELRLAIGKGAHQAGFHGIHRQTKRFADLPIAPILKMFEHKWLTVQLW